MGRKTRRTINYEELEALLAKKSPQPFHTCHIYLNVVFRLNRFGPLFRVPDLGARDFDLALQMCRDNYRAGEKMIHEEPLLHQIIKSLAKPYFRNMSDMSFDEKCYTIIQRRFLGENEDDKQPHPLGSDPKTAKVQTLPNEAMIYFLSRLLDLRIQSDEAELVDEHFPPEKLRPHSFGSDGLGNEYFYLGDFRIFVKLKKAEEYEGTVPEDQVHRYPWSWVYNDFANSSGYKMIADTREGWKHLIGLLSTLGDAEKQIAKAIEVIFSEEQEIYQEELNRRARLNAEERRLEAFKEREQMKLLGVVRTSSRIQAKELERKKFEEEQRRIEKENRKRKMEMIASGQIQDMPEPQVPKAMTREERHMLRDAKRAEQRLRDEDSIQSSVQSSVEGSVEPCGVSEDGQSTRSDSIQPLRGENRSSETDDSEMNYLDYSGLNVLHHHQQQPSSSNQSSNNGSNGRGLQGYFQNGNSTNGYYIHKTINGNTSYHPNNYIIDDTSLVAYCVKYPYGTVSNGHNVPNLHEFYQYLYAPIRMRDSEEYRNEVRVAERLVKSTLTEYYSEWLQAMNTWPSFESLLILLQSPNDSSLSRLHTIQQIDRLIAQNNPLMENQKQLLTRCVEFISAAWTLMYQLQSPEDVHAKAILKSLTDYLKA